MGFLWENIDNYLRAKHVILEKLSNTFLFHSIHDSSVEPRLPGVIMVRVPMDN